MKLNEWTRRVNFSERAHSKLGFGIEYWKTDLRLYEASEALKTRLKSLGRKPRKTDLAYDLCSHLLDDVLVAAGGVENSIVRLREAVANLSAYALEHELRARNGVPQGLSHPTAAVVWYAFSDVLTWSRTLVERVERPAGNRKKFPEQGLLPAIKPKRLRKRCERLFAALKSGPVGQSRTLANFILHTALVNHPYSGVRLDEAGSISLPVPDLPNQRVGHWYLLTWAGEQDGIELAEQIWDSLQQFVEGLIGAFEKSVPKRLRRSSAQ